MSSFKLRKEQNCLNCGEIVEKHFCPSCGQENIEVKEDAFHMTVHAVADYFHFEHKFFSTIKPLLFKPGKLTQEYVAGKRMTYIHPIRLYIFISIVFFLVVLSGQTKQQESSSSENKKTGVNKYTDKQIDSLFAIRLKKLEKKTVYQALEDSTRKILLDNIKKDLKQGGDGKIPIPTKGWNVGNGNKFAGSWSSKDTTVAQYEANQLALAKPKRDGFLKHYFTKRSIELNKYPNPKEKFLEELFHNVPKMMFFILPIFAMILKLVYINKNKYFYEHLIYSFHVHSALFLSMLVFMLLNWIIGFVYNLQELLTLIGMIYMLWYIYRSLRTFYGSSRWVTVLKLFFLFFCYNIVLVLGFLLITAVSFAIM